jgi:glycosyltransferase involved in cell wall biosynthesis
MIGPMSVGKRAFDFDAIDTSPRGLTGTDGSFLGYSEAMVKRGHDVTIFASSVRFPREWRGCAVRPFEDRRVVDDQWDAALAWNDIVALQDVSPKVLRVLDLQCNDFSFTKAAEHAHVDLYATPSATLGARLRPMAEELGGAAPWVVVPNGCDPGAYGLRPKVPGRCIFTSSPDRGLHLVIEQWRAIREAVPGATLRIFYHAMDEWFGNIEGNLRAHQWDRREHARRAVIVRDALPLLEAHGVELVGSVSRERMAVEYSEAECLTGPTDTLSFTEGFGVAVLEGCAAGAVPCVSTVDAFGEVYGGAAPMVVVPEGCHRFLDHPELAEEWRSNVINALTNPVWREVWVERGRAFAGKHAWPVLAEKLESILVEAKARKS